MGTTTGSWGASAIVFVFGAEDEFTLRRNREAFDRVDLIPRIATETGLIDTSVELFGLNLDYPLLVAGRNS